ncbi:glycine--tRNA ligase [Thermoplasmatales archaeon ex4484_30]|nr:MAG: glycine--tRNA ligase [Thermoplasmata archaeon]OYT59067.1 MAG: glycine--tRNA ligase [Thermoplasmatales archaeon ex4484_30]
MNDIYDKLMAVAKRRGFLYPSYEIYGGEAGFYDYGPLGSLLKNNIENVWRKFYISQEGFYEISTPVITPYEVLKASGHVDEFIDEIGTCIKCNASFKVEELKDEKCPICGGRVKKGKLNLMFETFIGAKKNKHAFLRPETAQGIFVNFPMLYEFFRRKIPFGVVQIGKGFRNEVSPRQGIIRLREFSMAEAEIFFSEEKKKHHRFMEIKEEEMRLLLNEEEMKMKLGEAVETGIIGNEALAYYMALTKNFLLTVGIDENKLRFRKHKEDELAHYANECWDAELYSERFGWIECVGIADRSAYDLQAHMKASGAEMRVFEKYEEPRIEKRKVIRLKMDKIGPIFKDKAKIVKEKLENMEIVNEEKITVEIDGKVYEIGKELYEIEEIEEKVTGRRYIPHVIEPSYGIDRIFYFILEHNYKETKKEGEKYVILSLPACIAPIKAGVFPLVNKDGLPEIAREIEKGLRKKGIMVVYDDSGSIGRRYARMDEIGTPFCITVDYQTKEDDTITIRFRDTTEQIRLQRQKLADWLKERIEF